jgi:MFS family permease
MTEHNPHDSWWKQIFRGNIFVLGLVSFLTDVSTEMIYPLLPVFFSGLVTPATVAVYIGLMEGLAEATASLLKFYSGRLSDRLGRRKSFALAGYAVSSIVRPFTAGATFGWEVLAIRLLDRVGKGIRTAPRDALLSQSVEPEVRGRAFSFHRLMDHAGAVFGPLAAFAFLSVMLGYAMLWSKGGTGMADRQEMAALRWLFALAAVPGLAATFVLWRWVRENPAPAGSATPARQEAAAGNAVLPSRFILFLVAVVLFTLGNSSDLFLVFYAQERFGSGLGRLLGLWVFLHLSKIVFSLPGGWFADRLGHGKAIICGWIVYIGVYAAMPFVPDFRTICALLLFYGLFYGMTEGAEKALVAQFVPAQERGRAYGLYHGAVGLATLPASLVFGVFWARMGSGPAFFLGAGLAFSAVVVLTVSRVVHADFR